MRAILWAVLIGGVCTPVLMGDPQPKPGDPRPGFEDIKRQIEDAKRNAADAQPAPPEPYLVTADRALGNRLQSPMLGVANPPPIADPFYDHYRMAHVDVDRAGLIYVGFMQYTAANKAENHFVLQLYNQKGQPGWSIPINANDTHRLIDMAVAPDGGTLYSAAHRPQPNVGRLYIARHTLRGETVWNMVVPGELEQNAPRVCSDHAGGMAMLWYQWSHRTRQAKTWLMHVPPSGKQAQWKRIGVNGVDFGYAVAASLDGSGYFVVGQAGWNYTESEIRVVKVGRAGGMQWMHALSPLPVGQDQRLIPNGLTPCPDGGVYVVGQETVKRQPTEAEQRSQREGRLDPGPVDAKLPFIARYSAHGQLLWKTHADVASGVVHDAAIAPDGNLIVSANGDPWTLDKRTGERRAKRHPGVIMIVCTPEGAATPHVITEGDQHGQASSIAVGPSGDIYIAGRREVRQGAASHYEAYLLVVRKNPRSGADDK